MEPVDFTGVDDGGRDSRRVAVLKYQSVRARAIVLRVSHRCTEGSEVTRDHGVEAVVAERETEFIFVGDCVDDIVDHAGLRKNKRVSTAVV